MSPDPGDEVPPHRYTAALAAEIERHWQDLWEREGTFEAPNPAGPLGEPDKVAGRPKLYVLDMFPYPSGTGLHVGHPLGYIATDAYGRYKRMTGHNVLHALGYDASACRPSNTRPDRGASKGHHGVQRREHATPAAPAGAGPRSSTQRGDHRRGVLPLDQWIFLQVYNAWYDKDADIAQARPAHR